MSEELKRHYLELARQKRQERYNHAKAIQRNAILMIALFGIMSVLAVVSLTKWAITQSRLDATQTQLRTESLKAAEFQDWYNRTCQGEPISDNGVCNK